MLKTLQLGFVIFMLVGLAFMYNTNQKIKANQSDLLLEIGGVRLRLNNFIESSPFSNVAFFTPSAVDNGNQPIANAYGIFPIGLMQLTKVAGGYKATFIVINPYAIPFSDPKLFVRWGNTFQYTQTVSPSLTIAGGGFTTIDVVLSPATEKDIQTFNVALNFLRM